MKKSNIKKITISILCFLFIGLTACSSKQETIAGKYISIYDESNYLIFEKNGSVISNMWTTFENGEYIPRDCIQYSIDENNMVVAIDTTEYVGQDSLNEYEIGILYKDYICIKWNGSPIRDYIDTTMTHTLGDLVLKFELKKDKSYEFSTISYNEVVDTETGTYLIKDNEIVCTSNEGLVTTFMNIDENIYSIEYAKD